MSIDTIKVADTERHDPAKAVAYVFRPNPFGAAAAG
jgi:hypothetical protein